jgi:flagellar biogenesis protein FliO
VKMWRTISVRGRRWVLRASATLTAAASLQFFGAALLAADESISISPRGSQPATPVPGSAVPSWSRTSVALGATLGAAVIGLFIARRFMPGLSPESRVGQIQILGQTPLGTRGIVYVLRCGPRVLIVGATSSHINTLAEIADPDEIDQFRGTKSSALPRAHLAGPPDLPAADFKGQLHGMLDKIERWSAQG